MSNFKAKIIAELDTTQVEQKINELDGKKVKFGVNGGNAQKEVEKVDNSIKSATKSTKTFGETLKTSAKLGTAYSITSQAFQAIREAASKAKEAVQEFDAAVMDLRMATGGTYTEVSNLVKGYNVLGKEIGATTKEVSNGADSWLRQGHSIADTNTLIKDSMILSKVAELESAEATSYLTSIMKGYEIEVENVIGIVDRLTSVDLVSAVDAGGIAEGISKTAVSANTAGVSLDKLIGYLAATGEVTQESMSVIGNAFKTFFARYSAIKSGKLELIDEDGTIEVLSDVEQSLKNVGIDIRTTITDFDNAGDVLDNLAEKWDNLNSVQKSAIASAFGGTRQKERFLVLMENYSQATSYMETSMNSAGTAEQKFGAYLDSLEAKTKSLQASFESLAINTFSTEMFGGIIDATSSIVTFLDKTNLLKGTLVGLTAAGVIKAFTMLTTGITNASIRLNEFNSALKLVKAGNIGENEVQMLAKITSNLSQSQLKAILSSKALSAEQRIAILTAQGMSAAEAKAALSLMSFATAEGAATTSTFTLSGALKGLWATLMANPLILVVSAVTTAVSAYSSYKQKVEEAQQVALEAGNVAKDEANSIRELYSSYQEANNAYKNNTGSKEILESTTDSLLKSLRLEEAELEKLQEKYGGLDKAINNVTVSSLKSALTDLTTGYQSALDKLLKITDESYFSGVFGQISSGRKEKLGTAFTDILEDAGLISKGSNGDTGGYSIILGNTGKTETLDDVIAIYEDITSMQKVLEQGVSEGKYTREELANSNIWKGLSNKLNSFSEEYANIFEYIDSINQTSAQIQILEWEQNNVIPETEREYFQLRDKMIAIAQSSGEFIGTHEQIEKAVVNVLSSASESYGEFETIISNTKNAFVNTMSTIQNLSSGFDKLKEIYSDIRDKGNFDYSKVFNNEDFKITFGALDSYNAFLETIANSPDDINVCKEAFNNLVLEYITASKTLDTLTDSEIDATISFLEQNGVVNASILVQNNLANARNKNVKEVINTIDAIESEIIALEYDAETCEYAESQFYALAAAEAAFNNQTLDVSQKISALQALAAAAGVANAMMYPGLMEEYTNYAESTGRYKTGAEVEQAALQELYKKTLSDIKSLTNYKPTYNTPIKYSPPSDNSSSSSSNKEDEVEHIDWIEIALTRVSDAIDKVKNTASSAYNSIKTKLIASKDEISLVNKELALQQKAYERYMKEANLVGLSEDLKEKIHNGAIDISKYDAATADLIKEYEAWYNKAQNCSDAVQQLHENLASLYEDKFSNNQEDFENQLDIANHLINQYENGIDMLEARGYLENIKYYSAMQDIAKSNIEILTNELLSLEKSFSDAMNSGEIEKYSEAWYSFQTSINGVKEELAEANVELVEYAKTMREIEWGYFDYTQERISQITQEADFLIDLLSNSDLHTAKGQLTDEGMATMGLHGQNYNVYMEQATMYAEELAEINAQLAKDPYNTELIERREELLGLQQDSILAAEDEKQAIVALVEEGINLELQAMQDLIDEYTSALDSAKDLYEYQKKIKEQTENIGSLRKQLAAYENDLSEETRAKVQKLTVELAKSEEELAEAEYDQYISDQKKLLDELYLEYETILNQRLDNVDALIGDMITAVNDNSGLINETLTTTVDNAGYTMSQNMQNIWNGATGVLDGTISKYGDDFSTKFTAVQSVLNSIQANTAAMVAASDKEAQDTVDNTNPETTPSAPTTLPSTSPVTQPTISSTPEKTITVGGKINAKGAKIYDYAGDTSGELQYFGSDPIYKVLDEKNGYLKVRHHKLSSGVTGWFKKSDVKAYKTGGLVDYTGLAQVDGTPGKPELMLNAEDTENFLELKNVLREMSMQELTIGDKSANTNYSIDTLPQIIGVSDISSKLAELRNNTVSQNHNVSFGDTNISIDHVQDYADFVTQLQKDKQFEKMILSMTINRVMGGSSLDKYKYKWK